MDIKKRDFLTASLGLGAGAAASAALGACHSPGAGRPRLRAAPLRRLPSIPASTAFDRRSGLQAAPPEQGDRIVGRQPADLLHRLRHRRGRRSLRTGQEDVQDLGGRSQLRNGTWGAGFHRPARSHAGDARRRRHQIGPSLSRRVRDHAPDPACRKPICWPTAGCSPSCWTPASWASMSATPAIPRRLKCWPIWPAAILSRDYPDTPEAGARCGACLVPPPAGRRRHLGHQRYQQILHMSPICLAAQSAGANCSSGRRSRTLSPTRMWPRHWRSRASRWPNGAPAITICG